jgi:hypothetical protein
MYQIVPNPGSKSIFVQVDCRLATEIASLVADIGVVTVMTRTGVLVRCSSESQYLSVIGFFVDRYLEVWS